VVVEDQDPTHHEVEDFVEPHQLETTSVLIAGSTDTGRVRVQMVIGATGALGVEGMGIYDETVQGRFLVANQKMVDLEAGIGAHPDPCHVGDLGPDRDLEDDHATNPVLDLHPIPRVDSEPGLKRV